MPRPKLPLWERLVPHIRIESFPAADLPLFQGVPTPDWPPPLLVSPWGWTGKVTPPTKHQRERPSFYVNNRPVLVHRLIYTLMIRPLEGNLYLKYFTSPVDYWDLNPTRWRPVSRISAFDRALLDCPASAPPPPSDLEDEGIVICMETIKDHLRSSSSSSGLELEVSSLLSAIPHLAIDFTMDEIEQAVRQLKQEDSDVESLPSPIP